MNIPFWQCPQNPEHVFDKDDWRVQPTNEMNNKKWFRAFCPFDGRELDPRAMEVK